MDERELTEQGEAFIRGWYARIDAKVPFEEIVGDTAGESLIVDFPGNPLDFCGFKSWYEGQCRDFTGRHQLHTVRVSGSDTEMEIFSEITWTAEKTEGGTLTLYPNVTLRLVKDGGWKVCYYGCVDRK